MKKRIKWIDFCKGILIFLVIIGHAIRPEMRNSSKFLDYSYYFIYTIHMSFFMFISGYLLKRLFLKKFDIKNVLIHKFKKMIVPWLIYTLIIYIIFCLSLKITHIANILNNSGYELYSLFNYLTKCFQANNPYSFHLWFIYILFIIETMIVLFYKYFGRKSLFISLFICLLMMGFNGNYYLNSWNLFFNYIFIYTPFVILGIYIEPIDIKRDTFYKMLELLSIFYLLSRVFIFSGGNGNNIVSSSYFTRFLIRELSYIFLTVFIIDVCKICNKIMGLFNEKNVIIKIINYMGENSFYIYLIHQPFFCVFLSIILYQIIKLPAFVSIVICLICSVFFPILFFKILNKIKRFLFEKD